MNFEFGNTSIHLSPIITFVIFAVILYLLWRWSKELENRSFTIFLYFMISTYTAPIFSRSTSNGDHFELWVPLGFIIILVYLVANKKNHPAKMKASLLGLAVGIYKLIEIYRDLLF
ncbi:hypothetical protein BABA_07146 [Neobacillus bataviensis LMG 21833]|uniref:Glycosyltransferase RgtA/B/C/D-like domain-containing protein n=1 Tax=Neobacillus bataviensis LMG 21833 TaxID=1117379 RepID=K6DP81_9BACI|nr:hypothetical protein [Neobacillus bataviensis]EKN70134.1 hypothetical protein BABA_07146 [Neobacillus bataviensis LMG 21833]